MWTAWWERKSYLYFGHFDHFDGGTAERVACPWAQHVCLSPGRKHPWCFHNHSRPVLLSFTSAFMWLNPKANLWTHNMFRNQWLRTQMAAIIIQMWSSIKKKQNKTFKDDLQFKSVAVWIVFPMFPVFLFFSCPEYKDSFYCKSSYIACCNTTTKHFNMSSSSCSCHPFRQMKLQKPTSKFHVSRYIK